MRLCCECWQEKTLPFGDQGRSHNYHFTFEVAGTLSFVAADTLNFTGDDDLWMFINDQLVLDIGGVHAAVSDGFDGLDLINTCGLAADTNYDFKIFFAERHTTESNFTITTTLPLSTGVPVRGALPLVVSGLAILGFAVRRRRDR